MPCRQPFKIALTGISLLALAACGAADRISSIGKTPEFKPIEDVNAPLQQRTIGRPIEKAVDEPEQYAANSLWRTGARAFFKDQRAGRIGDILTVEIDIQDQAIIGNTTTRTRQTSEDVGIDNFLGLETIIPRAFTSPNTPAGSNSETVRNAFSPGDLVGADSASNFTGNGTVNRQDDIEMTVAALVVDVLPNGNLVIQGRQEVRVNFEKRILLLAGIVRPEDISAQNTIQHSQIAEARIAYGGQGQLTDVQQPRYGQQLYDIIFPF